MRKKLLTLVLTGTTVGLFAQTTVETVVKNNATQEWKNSKTKFVETNFPLKKEKQVIIEDVVYEGEPKSPSHFLRASTGKPKVNAVGEVIGTTFYDRQENYAAANRTSVLNGKVMAIWTGSTLADFTDRGTFYNFHDGSAWGALPTGRIEPEKTGWPTGGLLGNGGEIVMAHLGGGNFVRTSRPAAGTGTWDDYFRISDSIPEMFPGTWPDLVIGGPGDSTVHFIIPERVSGGAGEYILFRYSRSLDGGKTWDIKKDTLPGTAPTDSIFYGGGADIYNIAARDSFVAIIYGFLNDAVTIWKSSDNGSTWTRTKVTAGIPDYMDAPDSIWAAGERPITDANNDSVPDTVMTTYGTVTLSLDKDGKVHVAFDAMGAYQDADTTTNFFYRNALAYWNEDFGPDSFQVVGAILDRDGDGTLNGLAGTLPGGYWGYASQPQVILDDDSGHVYVVYRTYVEYTDLLEDPADPTAISFSDIFGAVSKDGGATWMAPVNLTQGSWEGLENIYPHANKKVEDGKVHLWWQRDEQPGTGIGGEHTAVENEIVYMGFSRSDFIGKAPTAAFTTIYPFNNDNAKARFQNGASGEIDYYIWSYGDGSANDTTFYPNSQLHTYSANGSYEVCLTVVNRFGADTTCDTVEAQAISIEEHINIAAIYPNPTEGNVNVELNLVDNSNLSIEVFNAVGQSVKQLDLGKRAGFQKVTFDVSEQPTGIYILKITADDAVVTRKITLE